MKKIERASAFARGTPLLPDVLNVNHYDIAESANPAL
jgi:hypothetical protein